MPRAPLRLAVRLCKKLRMRGVLHTCSFLLSAHQREMKLILSLVTSFVPRGKCTQITHIMCQKEGDMFVSRYTASTHHESYDLACGFHVSLQMVLK